MTNKIEDSVIYLLHRAGQVADSIYGQSTGDMSLTPRQYLALKVISERDGQNQTEIVHSSGIDRSTMADIVRRMIKSGLIQRKRCKDDARAYNVSITALGEQQLRRGEVGARRAEEQILGKLSATARRELLRSLQHIAAIPHEQQAAD